MPNKFAGALAVALREAFYRCPSTGRASRVSTRVSSIAHRRSKTANHMLYKL